jgi:hypothetical protein
MSRLICYAAGILMAVGTAACDDGKPMNPTAPAGAGAMASQTLGPRIINIKDACDSTTFNTLGPNVCIRNGGVTLTSFLSLLGQHHNVGGWHYAPGGTIKVPVGTILRAVNGGGETHTFTEVDQFGGGFLDFINEPFGNTVPAPECLALASSEFIAPGAFRDDPVEHPGIERYQCCIHPWMRLTVEGR